MTNLDSILKSREFANKGLYSQSYGFSSRHIQCENWTIKKAKHWKINAFELWCWWRLLTVPWPARGSNQSIVKEIGPEDSLEGLMLKLKLQYFGHRMWRTDSLEKTLMLGKIEGRRKRGWQDEMVGWHHWLDGREFEQVLGVGQGPGSLVCCSPWGCKESYLTERLKWTELGCLQRPCSNMRYHSEEEGHRLGALSPTRACWLRKVVQAASAGPGARVFWNLEADRSLSYSWKVAQAIWGICSCSSRMKFRLTGCDSSDISKEKYKLRFKTITPVLWGLPHDSDSKESVCNAGDLGSIPKLERSPGEGNDNQLQYSCLENPLGRRACQATVRGLAKSQKRLSN